MQSNRRIVSTLAFGLLAGFGALAGPSIEPRPRRQGLPTTRKPLGEHKAAILAAEAKRLRRAEKRRQLGQRLKDRHGG